MILTLVWRGTFYWYIPWAIMRKKKTFYNSCKHNRKSTFRKSYKLSQQKSSIIEKRNWFSRMNGPNKFENAKRHVQLTILTIYFETPVWYSTVICMERSKIISPTVNYNSNKVFSRINALPERRKGGKKFSLYFT